MRAQSEATRREEDAVSGAQAQVDRLQRRQRELLHASQAGRAALARELLEERILRNELAAEAEADF